MHARPVEAQGLPIAAVEQSTGIARATLRIWERRYGFPQPGRDPRGERSYPGDQVEKLRLMAQLMARGHRPGRLVQLDAGQLTALAQPGPGQGGALRQARAPVDDPVIPLLRDHDASGVSSLLESSIRAHGLGGFITGRMAAMNVNVGLAWARGDIEVFEEHLYSEIVQNLVRRELGRLQSAPQGPRVLLATLPEEGHTLGLLMAQAMVALEGCPCTSLGARVPVQQLAKAARAFGADVVGVSFTASMNPSHVLRGLDQLRGDLPPEVAVWAGGSSPVLARHRSAGVHVMPHIADVPPAVARWRAGREAPPAS
ncbi:MAG TPA: cobalamin-dependent protein [Ramlibacter sp.]|nr:cobalamin-dependent protein [Ramlibacter sp.]